MKIPNSGINEWAACVDALNDKHLQRLASWRHYSIEFCHQLKEQNLIGLFQGRIAFPLAGSDGQVHGCHHRPLETEGSWLVTFFTSKKVPMFPLLINDPRNKMEVVVFESQWDALSYLELVGWPSVATEAGCIVTRGAQNGKRVKQYCHPDAKIIAVSQNDDAAKKWLKQIVQAANGTVLHVRVPEPHKDFNDWVRGGATLEQVSAAIDSAEILKEEIKNGTDTDLADDADGDGAYAGMPMCEVTMDGRIFVELPHAANRLISEFASDMGHALSETDMYNRAGLPFTLDYQSQTLKLMAVDSFRTWSEKYVVCFEVKEVKDGGTFRVRKSMNATESGTVLASEQFLQQLRSILKLNQVRLPVIRDSGVIELLPTGYDPESKTYTFEAPGVDYPKELTLEEGKAIINDLFKEFCFPDDKGRSLAVAVAAMLTLFGYGCKASVYCCRLQTSFGELGSIFQKDQVGFAMPLR
jgi:hypothetical protein